METAKSRQQIISYLKKHGWICTGDGHWYNAERDKKALDYKAAMYYEENK